MTSLEWKGGFAQSNPAFAYPQPNLKSLPMLGNMDNIRKLQFQQKVMWPEFSWASQPEAADPKRCFQMFAPDISRIGYTDTGRVYSIICPQQGMYIDEIGYMNVEITVTGQRGWVDEATRELAADMQVQGQIWFSPSATRTSAGLEFLRMIETLGYPVPAEKRHAIQVTTHAYKNSEEPIFPVRKNETSLFVSPDFARHEEEAWTVGNIEVEIGPLVPTGNKAVDAFNELFMELFNLSSGNMLKSGNLLSWNVWFQAPEPVDQEEWQNHAEKWRKSIDADHGSPEGEGTGAKYFDNTPFSPVKEEVAEVRDRIRQFFMSKSLLKHSI